MEPLSHKTVNERIEKVQILTETFKAGGAHLTHTNSGKSEFTKVHDVYRHIHFALNCPIYKNTYFVLI